MAVVFILCFAAVPVLWLAGICGAVVFVERRLKKIYGGNADPFWAVMAVCTVYTGVSVAIVFWVYNHRMLTH